MIINRRFLAMTALAGISCTAACVPNEIGRIEADTFGDLTNGDAPRKAFNGRLLADCGPGGNTAIGDDVLLRQPYVQRVTSSSAVINWTAVADELPSVHISSPATRGVTTVTARVDRTAPLPEGRQYTAEITGLEPGQTYCYEIAVGDQVWVTKTGFATAPAPDVDTSETPIRFIALGDLGERTIDQFAVRDQLLTVESDFALITGDVAYDNGKLVEFETNVFDVYAPLFRHVPAFPASGNHDYEDNDAAAFRQVFSLFENGGELGHERWYSFDWGPIHIAVLDTEKYLEEQVVWLANDLGSSTAEWKIVIAHRPPFSSGWHGSDQEVQDLFVPIFERYRVDLVLLGHDHHYERINAINGVTYVIAGAGGRGTRPTGKSGFTALAAQVSHFVYGELSGSELKLFAIDGVGQMFDSVVIRH